MIRLVHLADTHLGVENYGRLDPATGLSSRLGDFLRALDQVVDHAVEHQADLVVFAGDAYNTRAPSPTHQREFARRVRRLTTAGIPCFLLVGNHDLPNAQSRAHTTEIFDTLAVDKVTVARKVGTWVIDTRSGPIQVVALPWFSRSTLLSREEHKNRTLDELNGLLAAKVVELVQEEIGALRPELPAILVGHCTVMGVVYGAQKNALLGQELVLPRSLFASPSLNYVALGHIHRHQVLHDSPPVVYAGSLERIVFGEQREAKGFVDVTVRGPGQGAEFSFVPVSARRFLAIRANAGDSDPTQAALDAIAQHDVTESVVKIVVHTKSEVRLRVGEVRQALRGAHFIAAVVQEVEDASRRRFAGLGVEQMTPMEALAAYLEARQVPSERRQVLMTYARRLVEAETGGDAATG